MTLMKRLLALILLILCVSAPSVALAQQDDLIEPSEAQISLSEQAYAAFLAKDWEKAIEAYQSIIDIGPLNSAYASLGFALFKAGRCEEARNALDQAEFAPKVSNPPPAQVDSLLTQYRSMLNEQCEGSIIVTCPQPGAMLEVDGKAASRCDGNAIFLLPGTHQVRASIGDKHIEQTVVVEAMTTNTLTMEIPGIVAVKEGLAPDKSGDLNIGGLGTVGVIVGGAGVAMVIGALVIDLAVLGPSFQDFREASANNDLETFDSLKPTVDAQQSLVKGLLFSGAAIATAGLTLLVIDLVSGDEAAPGPEGVSGWVTPGSFGIAFTRGF